MIKGYVNGQTLRFEQDVVVTETIDYLHAEFSFDESWDGCAIWAHFTKGLELYDVLLDDEREIKADRHLNLGTGDWKVYLHGNRTVGAGIVQRITTEEKEIRVENTGVRNGSPLPEIEADVAEQLTALAQDAQEKAEAALEAEGDLEELETDDRSSLVAAVNELCGMIGAIVTVLAENGMITDVPGLQPVR